MFKDDDKDKDSKIYVKKANEEVVTFEEKVLVEDEVMIEKPAKKESFNQKAIKFDDNLQIFSYIYEGRNNKKSEIDISNAISPYVSKVSWGGNPAKICGFVFKDKKYIVK